MAKTNDTSDIISSAIAFGLIAYFLAWLIIPVFSPAYRWSRGFQLNSGYVLDKSSIWPRATKWQPGVRHEYSKHVLASTFEGKWYPEEGYNWKYGGSEAKYINNIYNIELVWVPGTLYQGSKCIFADRAEGRWAIPPSYRINKGANGARYLEFVAKDVDWGEVAIKGGGALILKYFSSENSDDGLISKVLKGVASNMADEAAKSAIIDVARGSEKGECHNYRIPDELT